MARIRSIKPDFFTDEDLAELKPITRILFVGLWCIADGEGRMEDRPKFIKVTVLPYDNCDVNAMLDDLDKSGFIIRYDRFIAIPNFNKHQRITGKEADTQSKYPPPPKEKQQGNNRETIDVQEGKGKEGKGKERKGKEEEGEAASPTARLLFDLWNKHATQSKMLLARELSRIRSAKCLKRLNERPIGEWEQVFSQVAKTPFLMGNNQRKWRASFDWIIDNSDNAIKVLEGKYDSNTGEKKSKVFL